MRPLLPESFGAMLFAQFGPDRTFHIHQRPGITKAHSSSSPMASLTAKARFCSVPR
jgi:hypothetical protein